METPAPAPARKSQVALFATILLLVGGGIVAYFALKKSPSEEDKQVRPDVTAETRPMTGDEVKLVADSRKTFTEKKGEEKPDPRDLLPRDSTSVVSFEPVKREDLPKDDHGVIVNDTYKLSDFQYLDTQRGIFVSKTFKATYTLNPIGEMATLTGHTFFIMPDLILYQRDIEKALANKKDLGGSKYRVLCKVHLLTDEHREAAARHINTRFPHAKVTKENIALLPVRHFKIFLPDKGVVFDTPDNPGKLATSMDIEFKGTEAELKHLLDLEVTLFAQFKVEGYQVKQNLVTGAMHALARMGFHHFLSGQASFESLRAHAQRASDAGFRIAPFRFGDHRMDGYDKTEHKSSVTRDQVRRVVQEASTVLSTNVWIEIKEKADQMEKIRDQLIKDLVGMATEETKSVKAEFDKAGYLVFKGDLTPDQIGELYARTKHKNKDKDDKNVKIPIKGATVEVDRKTEDDTELEWENKVGPTGTKIMVPKTIKVYQFNDTTTQKIFRAVHGTTDAEYVRFASIPEPVVYGRIIPESLSESKVDAAIDQRVDGNGIKHVRGDHEIDSGDNPTDVHFRAEASVEEDKIKLTISYKVHEDGSDHTEFNGTRTWEWKKSQGLRIKKLNVSDSVFEVRFNKRQRMRALEPLNSGTFPASDVQRKGELFKRVYLVADGDSGRDDRDVRYELDVAIPYSVVMEEERTELLRRHASSTP